MRNLGVKGFKSNAIRGAKAERAVAQRLQQQGAQTLTDTKGPGSTDIVAGFPDRRLRVQVKSSGIGEPANPSSEEVRNITNLAQKEGSEAWLAKVMENPNGVHHITFEELYRRP